MAINISPKLAQQLLQVMEHDLALASRLQALLQEERTRLEQRQYPAYQQVIKDKTQVLMELDQADSGRKQLMQAMGLSPDHKGFAEFLGHVPASWKEKFIKVRDALSDTMNSCARLNKVNGKILAHSQTTMERLMQTIRGTHNQPGIYQSNGRRTMGISNRVLATA